MTSDHWKVNTDHPFNLSAAITLSRQEKIKLPHANSIASITKSVDSYIRRMALSDAF
jgi:hypothetical protein